MIAETFLDLLKDPAHWYFELFLIGLVDGLIGALAWPAFKRYIRRHDERIHNRTRSNETARAVLGGKYPPRH